MADAVRPNMRRTRRFERTAPAAVILARGQVLPWMARRRQYVGIAFLPRCRRKQPLGFLAYGFGHATGLAVEPDGAAVFQIDPFPFERNDFATAAGKLELQADR